ncbi:MAG TPA: 2-C-methyl-D-erythritol 4-phosphate cytidylyltransferase [Acidimicrobiales bacterium]|nr:2-C-methyl-D-erythritol 4-phosphate cytidylyltransferase [Acidimicrobiales bacterium]
MGAAAAFEDDVDADVPPDVAVWAIVVAAGSGSRFGGAKQYALLGGRRVVDWSLATARSVCGAIVLVVPPDRAGQPEAADHVVAGGATRSASVRAGLAVLAREVSDDVVVVVHDAARPFATRSLFESVIAAVRSGADGAAPGLPITDTVKQIDAEGVVTATLDRTQLVTVQTPQAFRLSVLRAAHQGDGEATDDAALVEAWGGRVVVVPGEATNRKITTPADLSEPS